MGQRSRSLVQDSVCDRVPLGEEDDVPRRAGCIRCQGGTEAETEIDGQQPWWLWRLVWRDC